MTIERPDFTGFWEAPQQDGSWVIVPGALWTLVTDRPFDNGDLANIQTEDLAVFVWGRVVYDTLFEKDRVAEFRYRHWFENWEERRVPPDTSNPLGTVRVHTGWGLDPHPEGNRST